MLIVDLRESGLGSGPSQVTVVLSVHNDLNTVKIVAQCDSEITSMLCVVVSFVS